MLKFRLLIFTACCFLLFTYCKKDTKTETTKTDTVKPSVVFDFKATVDGAPLTSTAWYVNANADSFKVSIFNYYISNIKLTRSDGLVFSEPESYHLNMHMDGKETFTIANVPEGTYWGVEFLIGIDSTRNVSGAKSGDLDVNHGMFWDWTTGYLFFKIEGTYKNASAPDIKTYGIHIGTLNCLKKCTFNLDGKLVTKNNAGSTVFFHTRVDEIFKNPSALDLDSYRAVSGGRLATAVAENYADMFEIYNFRN